MAKQTERKEEIVICKHCGKPEYWGAMRWLSGRCACRNCYRSFWEDQNHKRYTWDDFEPAGIQVGRFGWTAPDA